ncbi:hypothetical protein [Bacillus sp. 3255]|nr:hypothetical protein [Bacillus sp. 3255]
MMWFAPVIIIGIGVIPNVAGSIWWDVIGGLLFLSVLIICGIGWHRDD